MFRYVTFQSRPAPNRGTVITPILGLATDVSFQAMSRGSFINYPSTAQQMMARPSLFIGSA